MVAVAEAAIQLIVMRVARGCKARSSTSTKRSRAFDYPSGSRPITFTADSPVFGQYKPEIEGFTYDLAADA